MRQLITPALVVLLVLPATGQLADQSFSFPDFTSVASLTLNGSATQMGNILELTPNVTWTAGSAWFSTPQPVVWGFVTTFDFRVTPPGPNQGADGFTMIIQNGSAGVAGLGQSGGPLGYGGGGALDNALVIEFDNWQNFEYSDTGDNEISVHANGAGIASMDESTSLGSTLPLVDMSDSMIHTARIEYIPGTLNVYLDNLMTPVLTVPYDFATGGTWAASATPVAGLDLPNQEALVGFTGATGGAPQIIEILSWNWTSTLPYDICFAGGVGAPAGGPHDVLLVGGSSGGYDRIVPIFIGDPIMIEMAQSPASTTPAQFVIWGHLGVPLAADIYSTPFGSLCLTPFEVFPVPWRFTLADSLSMNPNALAGATPTPWAVTLNAGLPIPLTVTLQGIQQDPTATLGWAITNGVVLDVRPQLPPTISSITPLSNTAGSTISILGTDFRSQAAVTVDGVSAIVSSVTPTQIDFALPAGVACDATVTVTHPNGLSDSAPFNPTPAITNTLLSSGPAAGGSNFVMTGSGFSPGLTVTIGGAAATVITVSEVSVVVSTPPGTVGTANVILTTAGGCSATTTYTYM